MSAAIDLQQREFDKFDTSGNVKVGLSSLPLPSGAATSAKQDVIIGELQVINSLIPTKYDSIEINYTDSTKDVIASVVFKLGVNIVSTLTPTFATTKDTWAKT